MGFRRGAGALCRQDDTADVAPHALLVQDLAHAARNANRWRTLMSKQKDQDQQVPEPDAADDVEGHSLALVMGMSQAERNRQQSRAKKPADDALPPLTKPFPRMRDDKKP
jgi:hypothetical protein